MVKWTFCWLSSHSLTARGNVFPQLLYQYSKISFMSMNVKLPVRAKRPPKVVKKVSSHISAVMRMH